MRTGVCAAAAALALVAAAPAWADGPADTTTATTTVSTATDPTTTVGTTVPATTTAPPTTTAPAYAAAAPAALPRCAAAGALAIVVPGRVPLALAVGPASLGPSAYPADGSVATVDAAVAAGRQCRPGEVALRSLSLFEGAVTVSSVAARDGVGTVAGIAVGGTAVTLRPGEAVAVGGWGRLVASERVGGTLTAPLALRLTAPHAGLPAGTVVLVGFASTPVAPPRAEARRRVAASAPPVRRRPVHRHRRRHRAAKHLPLTVTPPLGLTHYVFPVAGQPQWGDTYGGPRSDIADGWHHGDDLFAPIGTPVLAVADGTLNRVGWEGLGGWRLWLRDANGNQFYYAHLAAYSRLALRAGRVRAGEVIGFVGRTGDAYTTAPHLHFEIHPRPLLHLHYDGAVDPTRYLAAWPHETPARVPPPARPSAPRGLPRLEAAVVWRQLLAARGIVPSPPPHRVLARGGLEARLGRVLEQQPAAVAASARTAVHTGDGLGVPLLALLAGALAAAAAAFGAVRFVRRPRAAPDEG